METKTETTSKYYVYDGYKKAFFISKGCKLYDANIHLKTRRIYWIFDFNEVSPYFEEWDKYREPYTKK